MEKNSKRHRGMRVLARMLCALVVSLSIVSLAYAAGAAEDGHGAEHHASIGTLFWPLINFLLYASIMFVSIRKHVKPSLQQQRAEVKGQYESGQSKLADAKRRLAVMKARSENVEQERADVIRDLKHEGSVLSEAILEKSVEECDYVVRDVSRRIASERVRMESELRAEVVRQATNGARKQLQDNLDAKVDARLRQEAVASFRR